ncbi:MAG: AAA family ATPase [Oscillospiraceae bacterium]|nr:AAA family ATPase [Oscillospiraceae bacterium]
MDDNRLIKSHLKKLYSLLSEEDLKIITESVSTIFGKSRKSFLKNDTHKRIEIIIDSIVYSVNNNSFNYLVDTTYNHYKKYINIESDKNYKEVLSEFQMDNRIFYSIYILYKFCKPPFKANLINFINSPEFLLTINEINSLENSGNKDMLTIQNNSKESPSIDFFEDSSKTNKSYVNQIVDLKETIKQDTIERTKEKMKFYIGFIEKRGTFFNFRPEYELLNNELIRIEDKELKFPKYGKINFGYTFKSISDDFLSSLKIRTNYPTYDNLYAFVYNDFELEENKNYQTGELIEDVQKKIDLQKLVEKGIQLDEIIKSIDTLKIVKVVTPTVNDLNDKDFIDGMITIQENYEEGTTVLLSNNEKLYGPYVIKERKIDGTKYIKPDLSSKNYILSYFDNSKNDKVYQIQSDDGYVDGFKTTPTILKVAILPKKDNAKFKDLIPNDVLIEELGRIYNFENIADNDKSKKIELLKQLSKNSSFFTDSLPGDIKVKRFEKVYEQFSDFNELLSSKKEVFKRILDSIDLNKNIDMVSELYKKAENTIKWKKLQEELDTKNEEINNLHSEIEELQKIKSEIKNDQNQVNVVISTPEEIEKNSNYLEEIKQQIKSKENELLSLKEEISNNTEINEYGNELSKLRIITEEKKKEIDKLKIENAEFEKKNKNIKKDIEKQIEDAISKTSADIAFDPIVSNAMLEKAAEWQKKESEDKYTSLKEQTQKHLDNVSSKGKIDLSNYLCEGIRKFRKYDKNDIINMLICISQNFLTIFAGNPGTGKTSICNIIANSLGLNNYEDSKLNRFVQVSVERGWSSKRDLIGYYNPLTKTYDKSNGKIYDALKLLSTEGSESNLPYLILLDEANLSPIEYYWSEFMRMADRDDGESCINIGEDNDIYIPETLRFVTTINNDQTTEPLSPRLLDRAWVIKLPEIELDYSEKPNYNEVFTDIITWDEIVNAFVKPEKPEIKLENVLSQVYKAFSDRGLVVSPRIQKSIRMYVIVAQSLMEDDINQNVKGYEKAIDYAILQKLLPKINGTNFTKLFSSMKNICNENHLYLTLNAIETMESQPEYESMGYCQYLG